MTDQSFRPTQSGSNSQDFKQDSSAVVWQISFLLCIADVKSLYSTLIRKVPEPHVAQASTSRHPFNLKLKLGVEVEMQSCPQRHSGTAGKSLFNFNSQLQLQIERMSWS